MPSLTNDRYFPLLTTDTLPLQVDQAALTGESLPVKKFGGDVAFSGSSIKQGERHAIVYATGANTFFGRAASLIGSTQNVANIQKVGFACTVRSKSVASP
jgi:H+-transporting ATPase